MKWSVLALAVLALIPVGCIAAVRVPPLLEAPVIGADVRPNVRLQLERMKLVSSEEPIVVLFAADYPDVSRNVKFVTDRRVLVFNAGVIEQATFNEVHSATVAHASPLSECFDDASLRCLFNTRAAVRVDRRDHTSFSLALGNEADAQVFIDSLAHHIRVKTERH